MTHVLAIFEGLQAHKLLVGGPILAGWALAFALSWAIWGFWTPILDGTSTSEVAKRQQRLLLLLVLKPLVVAGLLTAVWLGGAVVLTAYTVLT